MRCLVGEVEIKYVEHGEGVPLVALHGAGVDHREIEAAIEAVVPSTGYRRIYPDLPGMGLSSAVGLTCNDDVVSVLAEFVARLDEPRVLLLGHSYGAYLARGVLARRPDLVAGLALLCPIGERTGNLPEHGVVRQDADVYRHLPPEQWPGFDDYVVVRTAATARRYRDAVVPGQGLADEVALAGIFGRWTLDLPTDPRVAPTLIAVGRRDSIAGYDDATRLLDRYPGATLAVIADAGHALMHEQPELLGALLGNWLHRARSNA